jgi:methionine-rich copper-binding protein CopC
MIQTPLASFHHFVMNLLRAVSLLSVAFLCYTWPANAHAILVSAAPAANQVVSSRNVPVKLRFNSRVDAKRSRLLLVCPDGTSRLLSLSAQSTPDTLMSEANGLEKGSYVLRWQVLSEDGHITRGDLPFLVQ